jgi:hypothetical protein
LSEWLLLGRNIEFREIRIIMAKKKIAAKKKTGSKKAAEKKKAAKQPKAKATATAKKKVVFRRRTTRVTRIAPREISSGSERSSLGSSRLSRTLRSPRRGMGDEAGGQAGDLQGLSREEDAGAESVEELVEEGQAFEADVIDGVENAPDADEGPIRTHDRLEDDIPPEERSDET